MGVDTDPLPYLLPIFPMFFRWLVYMRYVGYSLESITLQVADHAGHRSLISSFAALSFAGLLGLLAIPGQISERALPIWYVLISFLTLLSSLNLQGYKNFLWQDWLADGLFETATLSLIASVAAFILHADLPFYYQMASIFIAGLVWGSDFILRVRYTISHLDGKEIRDGLQPTR